MPKNSTRKAHGAGTIRKKTITKNGQSYTYWEGRVTVGYNQGTGKQIQKSITGKTQKEVQEKINATLTKVSDGTYQEPSRITVSEWLDTWMNTYVESNLKPYTITSYKSIIKNHIAPNLGAKRLQALKGADVQSMYNRLIKKGSSAKTIKNVSAVLHKACLIAIKQGYITSNPCDAAELPKIIKKEINPLTDEQIPVFLEEIKNETMCNAYALCLFAGLREGECLGLSWKDVDFKRNKITVCQQLQREKNSSKYYIIKSTKGGKDRTIEPPAIAFEYLRAEQKRQAENRLRAGSAWNNPDNLVFTNELGNHFAIYTFYSHFKKIVARMGCPDARPHDLRHTAATVAIANGADIKSVQEFLGHATADFTLNVYAHVTERMQHDTAARVQSYYDNLEKRA